MDPFAVRGTEDDTLRCALIRDGIDFILNRCGYAQPCPDRVVKVGEGIWREYRARVDLRVSEQELFKLYVKQSGVLRWFSFKRYCILPQMKPQDPQTCLCQQCEAILHSTLLVVELLEAKALLSLIDSQAEPPTEPGPAAAAAAKAAAHEERRPLLAEARALLGELRSWRLRLKRQVHGDALLDASFFGSGKLTWAELEEAPLGDLFERIANLVLASLDDDGELDEWVREVLALKADLEAQLEHYRRWAWQEARYEQCEALLRTAWLDGKRYVMIVIDFKEKLPCNHTMRQLQSAYWDNSSCSCFGAVIMYVDDDGVQQSRNFDLLSEDTTQDSGWMASAFPVLAAKVAEMFPAGIDELLIVCDNAYHFHNGMNFAGPLIRFRDAVRARRFGVLFWEAGEGKGPADTHFANVGNTVRSTTRARGSISGVAQLVEIINDMLHTEARLLEVSRSGDVEHVYTLTGVERFKSFFLRADFDEWRVGKTEEEMLRGAWRVRRLTGLGFDEALGDLKAKAKQPKLSPEVKKRCLSRALQRSTGADRVSVLAKLLAAEPFLANSDCFGAKEADGGHPVEWHNAKTLLKGVMDKEYTAVEREEAGVGGQCTPHTIAEAILLLEHRRELAVAAGAPPAAVQAAAPPAAPPAPQPSPAASAVAALASRAQLLREALEEEQDTTTALANCRRRIRKLQEAVQTQGAQASAAADGVRQLGQSRWNAENAGERQRVSGWGRRLPRPTASGRAANES